MTWTDLSKRVPDRHPTYKDLDGPVQTRAQQTPSRQKHELTCRNTCPTGAPPTRTWTDLSKRVPNRRPPDKNMN